MRVLGPVITIAAIAVFVVTMLASAALTVVVPLIVVGIGIVAASGGHFLILFQTLGRSLDAFAQAFSVVAFVFRALAHPFRRDPPDQLFGHRVPDLLHFSRTIAAELGHPGVDDAFLLPTANFGVYETTTPQGPRRVLVAGAPLLFIFTVSELRAVIAHEIAHLVLGHTAWERALGRWREMMLGLASAQSASWHPVSLALVFSAWMFERAQAPWSRAQEHDADRLAARHFGGDAMISALRKTEDRAAALDALMFLVADETRRTGIGPESWTEAAYRRLESLSASERRGLRVVMRRDPFDVDGLTHPPYGVRSRAIAETGTRARPDERRAIAVLPDVLLEERKLTRAALRARRWVPAREWFDEVDPKRRAQEAQAALELTTGYPTLDLDR
ncbi:M48 family metalloprotease [Myxococcota bacterium]|nr:M48 family metalloprotease [Myxococcota bacterium]